MPPESHGMRLKHPNRMHNSRRAMVTPMWTRGVSKRVIGHFSASAAAPGFKLCSENLRKESHPEINRPEKVSVRGQALREAYSSETRRPPRGGLSIQ